MSEIESSPIEEQEPLTSITDVIGLKPVEPVMEIEAPASKLSPYDEWKNNPNKTTLVNVVNSLKPTINSVLASSNGAGDPQVASRARIIAAKAIQSYKPDSGASLPTWVSNQLRQIGREIRKSNNVMSIPEGVQLDAYKLYRTESEFMDEHGREPTVGELADKAGIPIKRIEKIRNKMKPVVNESSYETNEASLLEGSKTDFSKDALDYIYHDSDLTDQLLIERMFGYGGSDILDNKAIMERLKLTPVQLTRRKARLVGRINSIISALEDVQ